MASFELADIPSTSTQKPNLVLKRPPSYSDSYYILNGPRTSSSSSPTVDLMSLCKEEEEGHVPVTSLPVAPRIYLFFIKSAIHLFLISIFETLFFFQYVSITENNGILKTIDTYYTPLVNTCPSWNNVTKEVLYAFLTQGNEYNLIVSEGDLGKANRDSMNQRLLGESLGASGLCFGIVLIGSLWLLCKKIPVRWFVVFLENISMVIILGLYEYFFFRVIIYNYGTLSTPELNAYLVKGIYDCIT
jgi:hypothetical protein